MHSVRVIMLEFALFKSVSKQLKRRSPVTIIKKGKSNFLLLSLTLMGLNNAIIPIIKSILVKFEPITLPALISTLPEIALLMLTASSGRLVPIATTVKPIIKLDTFNFFATALAPLTKKSAPLIKRIMPIIRYKIFKNISIISLL